MCRKKSVCLIATRGYDAYEKDIAVLNVFFDSQAIMEFQTQAAQVYTVILQIWEMFTNFENGSQTLMRK